jgi:hypothetical protein
MYLILTRYKLIFGGHESPPRAGQRVLLERRTEFLTPLQKKELS